MDTAGFRTAHKAGTFTGEIINEFQRVPISKVSRNDDVTLSEQDELQTFYAPPKSLESSLRSASKCTGGNQNTTASLQW